MNKTNTLYQDVSVFHDKKTAIYFQKKKISFRELNQRIDMMAMKFYALGIHRDTVVSLLSPNIPEAVISLYALSKIGAIVTILHPLLPVKGLYESIQETSSSFTILCDVRYKTYLEELRNVRQTILFITPECDLSFVERIGFRKKYRKELALVDKSRLIKSIDKPSEEEARVSFPVSSDNKKVSCYLRSGGTTGRSKTVILNDSAIRYAGIQSSSILGRDVGDLSMIGVLPMFHGYGLAMGIHAPLMNHTSCYLMIHFDIHEIVKGINKNRINLLVGVPYMMERLIADRRFCNARLKNLYMTFVGADRPKETLVSQFDELMKKHGSINRLYEGYGLTEIVTVGVVNSIRCHKPNSVGKPIGDIKVCIVNPENRSQELPIGQDGEILISGESCCLGYLGTDEKHQPFFEKNGIRYVCTGDIGHLDKDGFLFFRNREKDLIKIAGYNVFPADIESLAEEVKGVVDAAAIYIPGQHPYIHLYIENHAMEDNVLANAVMKHLKENLIRYSLPEKVTCLPHFPRTNIGKIDRRALIHF